MSSYETYREEVAMVDTELAAANDFTTGSSSARSCIERAQVHATLALAAATLATAEQLTDDSTGSRYIIRNSEGKIERIGWQENG